MMAGLAAAFAVVLKHELSGLVVRKQREAGNSFDQKVWRTLTYVIQKPELSSN
jgi:hypothetical protein